MFTCANSNILIIPRKHTHCVFKNNQKKKAKIHRGWLRRHRERICWTAAEPWTPVFFSFAPSAWCSWPAAPPVNGKKKQNTTSSSRLHDRTFESARWRSRGRFEICETHPEHSAAKLDGHGQRERQLEFRDVDRQAGLQREGNNSNNAQVVRGTCSSWSQVRKYATLWQCLKVLPGRESMVSFAALRLSNNYRWKLFLFYVFLKKKTVVTLIFLSFFAPGCFPLSLPLSRHSEATHY